MDSSPRSRRQPQEQDRKDRDEARRNYYLTQELDKRLQASKGKGQRKGKGNTGDHNGRPQRETTTGDHKGRPRAGYGFGTRETTTGDHNGRPRATDSGDHNGRPQRETTGYGFGRPQRETTTGDHGLRIRETTTGDHNGRPHNGDGQRLAQDTQFRTARAQE